MILLLMACAGEPEPPTGGLSTPDESVDVLVVGSGAAGLCAAWEASEAGASVLVLERAAEAGGNGWHGGGFFGAGTSYQEELGLVDSPELALAQWEEITGEVPDAQVEAMIDGSADLIDWLVTEWGQEIHGIGGAESHSIVARQHTLGANDLAPVAPLVDALSPLVRLSAQADALTWEGERVTGVSWTDLETGDQAWIEAGAVVIATGGFARDAAALLADRPELSGLTLTPESGQTADGSGLPLLDRAGWQNQGHYGVYAHSIDDPTLPGEALWGSRTPWTVVVDLDGARVMDESNNISLTHIDALLAAPQRRLFAIYSQEQWEAELFMQPGFNWPVRGEPVLLSTDLVLELGGAAVYSDLAALAAGTGIDAVGIEATAASWEEAATNQVDEAFGKSPAMIASLGPGPYAVVELRAGPAKAFAGAATDLQEQILDPAGQPIPGLFGAGEAIGMLGTPAVGRGFNGSVTAVYMTGRTAGIQAAAAALAD